LQKDREYFLQKSERDADGALQKPDVVIELPDNKKIVIDSKVSLVAYDAMVAADDETDARKHRRNHALAIKNHINGLSAKNYHALYQVESPDYVLMFIPIDTAFSSAVSEDHTLFEYAFNKNIIIVTASTLLLSLKTFESLWKNEKQNKNALTIAAEAGKMYDKFAGFVEDMRKMGQQLNTVQKTYDGSMKKLSDGSGNLVRRAEKIKQLGANTNKVIAHTINDKLLIEPIG
jgi:DNA recombination protein RmuC